MSAEDTKNDIDKVQLKKSLSLASACSIIIGTIVGSGIFITPSSVLNNAGTPGAALIVWLTAGLISFTGAVCYCELGTMICSSGGDYAYINKTYGSLCSFLYVWMMVFVCYPIFNSISSITIAKYLVQLVFVDCLAPEFLEKLIATLILCLLGFINTLNIEKIAKMQIAFTTMKTAALLIIVFAGVWTLVRSTNSSTSLVVDWFSIDKLKSFDNMALALYSGLFTYSGWNCLNFLTEEMKTPSKDLPRSIMIAMPLVIVIFLVINCAYFIVLTPQEILFSDTVALTFSEKVFPKAFLWLTPFFIAFSAFGSLNNSILITSRIYYAAARDGNLPDMFATISLQYFTPITCIILSTVMSIAVLLVGDFQTLILYGAFSEFLFIGASISAILYLRYKRPDAIRPIKVFVGLPIIFLVVCVLINILTLHQNPYETCIGFLFLLAGVPVYCICIMWKNKPKFLIRAKKKILGFSQ